MICRFTCVVDALARPFNEESCVFFCWNLCLKTVESMLSTKKREERTRMYQVRSNEQNLTYARIYVFIYAISIILICVCRTIINMLIALHNSACPKICACIVCHIFTCCGKTAKAVLVWGNFTFMVWYFCSYGRQMFIAVRVSCVVVLMVNFQIVINFCTKLFYG